MKTKRDVLPIVRSILALDASLTNSFCNVAENFLPLRSLRIHYKVLEISCHGILWLAGWLAFIWLFDNPSLYQMQVNFYIGLILDIIFVAVIKAFTRRRRPSANRQDMFVTVGPDKFSFPSGHASRACFIAYFFLNLWTFQWIFIPPLLAWSTSICLSRVLLRRHHLLDVGGGILLGITEGLLVSWIWLSQDTSHWFVSWISDERLEGSSYHV